MLFKTSLLAAFASCAAFAFAGASATAGWKPDPPKGWESAGEVRSSDARPGALARFNKDGDRVWACDIQEDNFRAVVNVYKTYGNASRKHVYTLTKGGAEGTPPYNCAWKNAAKGRVYNLREGWSYAIEVCLDQNEGRDRFCNTLDVFA